MTLIEQIQTIDNVLPKEIKTDIFKALEKCEFLSTKYTDAVKHYNPGGHLIPDDKKYEFTQLSSRLKAFWNQYLRIMYLIHKKIELKNCDIDLESLRMQIRQCIIAYIDKIKTYLNQYGDVCMVQMVHYILCDADIPVTITEKWGFYKTLYGHQVMTINHMRKRDLMESLQYEFGDYIHFFKANETFAEEDFLVAGILLGYCRENSVKGERTALYFKSIVDRKMEEDIPQDQIIRILHTLFSEGYLDGYKAGKFHFIFEQE